MASTSDITVRLTGARRVEARVGRHVVQTDQPTDNGGEDSAPSPFDLFLASIGTCAGIFIQGFCAQRNIPYEEIQLLERPTFGDDGVLTSIDLEVRLPAGFPQKYREAVVKVAEQCSVKKALAKQPAFQVTAVAAP